MTATLVADQVLVVRMPKRIDIAVVPAIANDLESKIQTGRKIVLDFSRTESLDLKATDIFLEAVVKANQRSARLALRSVQPLVRKRLEIGGVLDYFRQTRRQQVA